MGRRSKQYRDYYCAFACWHFAVGLAFLITLTWFGTDCIYECPLYVNNGTLAKKRCEGYCMLPVQATAGYAPFCDDGSREECINNTTDVARRVVPSDARGITNQDCASIDEVKRLTPTAAYSMGCFYCEQLSGLTVLFMPAVYITSENNWVRVAACPPSWSSARASRLGTEVGADQAENDLAHFPGGRVVGGHRAGEMCFDLDWRHELRRVAYPLLVAVTALWNGMGVLLVFYSAVMGQFSDMYGTDFDDMNWGHRVLTIPAKSGGGVRTALNALNGLCTLALAILNIFLGVCYDAVDDTTGSYVVYTLLVIFDLIAVFSWFAILVIGYAFRKNNPPETPFLSVVPKRLAVTIPTPGFTASGVVVVDLSLDTSQRNSHVEVAKCVKCVYSLYDCTRRGALELGP